MNQQPSAQRRSPFLAALGACLLSACASTGGAGSAEPAEVAVLGAIHGAHRMSELWGIDELRAAIRAYQPDAVLCEIPPDRLDQALAEFEATGVVAEARVRLFPELTDAVFPLQAVLGYEIVPCAAWTQPMADARREQMTALEAGRPADSATVEAGFSSINDFVGARGAVDDPLLIHTDAYDEAVRRGMRPYADLFGEELGEGGWEQINAAHWALLDAALEERPGQRVLIVFGSWHKYWFRDRIAEDSDLIELDLKPFLVPAGS